MTIEDVVARWVQYNERGVDRPNHSRTGYLDFDRQVLRSYRTPIACYHAAPAGGARKGFVLFLSERIGTPWNTMTTHKNKAKLRVTWKRFNVPEIGVSPQGYANPGVLIEGHRRNVEWMVGELNTLCDGAIKMFKCQPDDGKYGTLSLVSRWIMTRYAEFEDYISATAADVELPPLSSFIERVATERERLWLAWSDPKAVARRERAKARKEAIIALGLGD